MPYEIQALIDKPLLLPLAPEKFPVERSEKPGLDLRLVTQLMTLRGPEKKSLLHEIARIGFLATEGEGKAIKRQVEIFDQFFEVRIAHVATVIRCGESRQGNRASIHWSSGCEAKDPRLFPGLCRQSRFDS